MPVQFQSAETIERKSLRAEWEKKNYLIISIHFSPLFCTFYSYYFASNDLVWLTIVFFVCCIVFYISCIKMLHFVLQKLNSEVNLISFSELSAAFSFWRWLRCRHVTKLNWGHVLTSGSTTPNPCFFLVIFGSFDHFQHHIPSSFIFLLFPPLFFYFPSPFSLLLLFPPFFSPPYF